jgi:imidazolonepropionase-like amidohydrolase
MNHLRSFLIALFLVVPSLAADPPKPLVFMVGRLHPASAPPIDDAVLVVEGTKIVAVGKRGEVAIPEGAVIHDLPNAVIIPGLVDTHSHIGLWSRPGVPANADGNEMSGPVQSGIRAIDAINPDDPGIKMAVAGGITTANIMPGSGNAIGGQTVYVKLRGRTIEEMRIKDDKTLGGLKMANGENPKGYGKKGQAPFTRMKVASLQREQFIKAREYQQKWQRYRDAVAKGEKATAPETDLGLEPLVEVLEKKRTVHFHCHRADDIMTAVRIAEEFGFDLVLQHATEGYRVAEELAKKKIPASLTLIDSPGGKLEVMGLLEENAAILDKAGVLVALNTDDSITESRFFLRTGSIAVRGGLSEDAALRTQTINAAKMLKLDHRIGSLEKGKEADFVILSGPPFSIYTQVLATHIDGVKRFDRSSKRDWTYQAGGFALTDLDRLPAISPVPKPLSAVKAPAATMDDPMKPAKTLAIRAGRVHTSAGAPIIDGVILIEDGKIKAIGPANAVVVPKGVPVVVAAEVTPGLIDSHSVCGLSGAYNIPADQDQDESSDPNQADLRVLDGFNPNDPHLEFLRANGVTIIQAMPGRANVIAGQIGIFRTSGTTVNQALIRFPAGMLVNLGEAPKGHSPKSPQTRMGSAGLVRTVLNQAKEHLAKKDRPERPANLKLDAFEPMLQGKLPVVFSAHRADDIMTGLRLAEEFKLKPILSLATEAYLIPEAVIASKAPVIVHPTMQRAGSNIETLNGFTGNAAFLADKKAPIVIGTSFEGYVPKTRVLRSEAAMAMTHGLGHERALRAVTIDAAKLLDLDKEYGSLEPGKIADIVLYDGEPFENATHVVLTVMQGRVVYSRDEYLKLPFERRVLALVNGQACCLGE